MKKPLVAIVGRPNVGKSPLFNRLIGRRVAIVEDTPGVPRARIYQDAQWLNYSFTLIDTGGIEPANDDIIALQMRRQAELAIETADVIIFLVDGREGMTSADMEVAEMLRRSKKPVVLGVNKVDAKKFEESAYEFYSLGLGDPIPISSAQGLNLGDLLDEVVRDFPRDLEEAESDRINIAVVGKPNVGKSSLVNALLVRNAVLSATFRAPRGIPSTRRLPGTGASSYRRYAGIRRKRSVEDETIERYSVIRSLAAIRRADVVLIVCDASQGLSEQDVRIAVTRTRKARPAFSLSTSGI
jgi:GTP-binding protein